MIAKCLPDSYFLSMIKFRFAALTALLLLSACQSSTSVLEAENFRLPAQSRYSCGSGKEILIANNGASISLTRPDGSVVDLPAADPSLRSRFGAGNEAIVFDGRSALYMDTGKPPLDCRR